VIHPQQIALAATCGYAALDVYMRPRVAILATGDELVPVEAEPAAGQIRNSNAPMLAAMVAASGGEPWILPEPQTMPRRSTRRSRRLRRLTCWSFRGECRQASSTWSSRRWRAWARASTSPG